MNAVKNFKQIVHEIANFYASALSRDHFTASNLNAQIPDSLYKQQIEARAVK